jgi:hypothetical protein
MLYAFNELSDIAKSYAITKLNELGECPMAVSDNRYLLEPNIKDIKSTKVRSDYKKLNEPLFHWDIMHYGTVSHWYIEFINLRVCDRDLFLRLLGIPKKLRNKLKYRFFFTTQRYPVECIEFSDFHLTNRFTSRELVILIHACITFDNLVRAALINLQGKRKFYENGGIF